MTVSSVSPALPKYYGFDIAFSGDVVIGHERIEDMCDELRVLHEQHYRETETLYLDVPFDPDYTRYVASEKAGQFVVFTARMHGELVGYLQYYVFRDMHSSGMRQAREDAFFFVPAVRGKGHAPKLLKFAEDALKKLGCRYVGMSSKAPTGGPDIGSFLERKGYRPVALYYVKQLEHDNAQGNPATTH